MAKKFKKLMASFMTLVMCMGLINVTAFAEEAVEEEAATTSTIWYGDQMNVDIEEGPEGYKFQSVYTSPRHAYEMSNHMLSPDGGASNDIPQTLVLVDASEDYTWTPDGPYIPGESNYEVLYCCDAETGYQNGVHYKRTNLEESTYYEAEEAAYIRAIITNSYPYISLDEMKAKLVKKGVEGAELLTRAEVISAVQAAVWAYANDDVGEYVYSQTFDVPSNSQWGTVMHDYTNEMDVWWETGKRVFSESEEVAARITALTDYLTNLKADYASDREVVVSSINFGEIVPIAEDRSAYDVALLIELNNSGSDKDDELDLTIYVGDEAVISDKITLGCEKYETVLEGVEAGKTITAVVSGKQYLPEGVYFYEPEGGRDVSQCLVGVAAGETEINASATVELPRKLGKADLVIQKTDENGSVLPGAAFDLYKEGEEVMMYAETHYVDENGRLELTGLLEGKYKLVESRVPNGYLAPTDDIFFEIDENGEVIVEESKSVKLEGNTLSVMNCPPHAAVVLTIDMSGTMYNNKMDNKRYVDVAKEKAKDFVEKYAASAANNGKRMLAVVCFDTDAKIQQSWIDVSTSSGLSTALDSIKNIKVAANGDPSSTQVCTNFDGGLILSRNLLKQNAVKDIDRCFNIILSDGAPTVTVNADTNTIGTIKSSFWDVQKDANGVKYQDARKGGGWTHPAEVAQNLSYLKDIKDLTCSYTVDGEKKEGIFIVGVGGLMDNTLFYDAVYGTSNGSRTDDVKKNPNAFNNVDALKGYTSDEIMMLTTGDWMQILADKVNGTYVSAANESALANQFDVIINAVVDTTALPVQPASYSLRSGVALLSMRMGADVDDSVVDEPDVDEPEADEPVVDKKPEADKKPGADKPKPEADKKPGADKPKPEADKKPGADKPKPGHDKDDLDVDVEGGKVTSWLVTDDGVTAIYIEGKGKEPSVVWTSEKVKKVELSDIMEELNADSDAKVICDYGTHKIEYQHNKNKTKTVTYTFS